MMELGHAIKLNFSSCGLPSLPGSLFCKLLKIKKKESSQSLPAAKIHSMFHSCKQKETALRCNLRRHINVCMYMFQTNLNAPQAVNSEMLPKCHVGGGVRFVLENCQTNAVQNQGFGFRLPHTETLLFVFLITSILVSLIWPCFSQVWIFLFYLSRIFSMICSQKMNLKLRCPVLLNQQWITWKQSLLSSPQLHRDIWQLSVCCFGFTIFYKNLLVLQSHQTGTQKSSKKSDHTLPAQNKKKNCSGNTVKSLSVFPLLKLKLS